MRKLLPFLFVFLAGCADVDRQLYNLSNAVAPVDRVTGQRSLNFSSREEQIARGNAETQKILAHYKQINEQVDAAQYRRVQNVFARVHGVSHLKNEQWKAYLLPDPAFNAFTVGGTDIFIFKGLMDAVQNDDELAAVIGHEIAHVTANHIGEQQAYTMAAKLKGNSGAGKQSFQAAFTLKNEEEADEIGGLYATLAGYDPYAAARLWKRMYDESGDFSAMIIDHPINSARAKRNEELAGIYVQYYMKGKQNPAAAQILRENPVFGSGERQEKAAGEGGGLMAVLETVGDTMNKRASAKAEQQKQLANQQFLAYVNQSLRLRGREVGAENTLRVALDYVGTVPVANLNLMAKLGNETATDHADGFVLQPGASIVATFKFKSADLRTVNLAAIPLGAVHAEQAN